jgi:hypothetical protein
LLGSGRKISLRRVGGLLEPGSVLHAAGDAHGVDVDEHLLAPCSAMMVDATQPSRHATRRRPWLRFVG